MIETKFTKGEMVVLPIESDKEYIRIRGTVSGGLYKIANVIDLKNHHDEETEWCKKEREEAIANAHLFAVANEMYAELVKKREFLSQLIIELNLCSGELLKKLSDEIDSIDLLLKKARGEYE